jgi:hypothetical protein
MLLILWLPNGSFSMNYVNKSFVIYPIMYSVLCDVQPLPIIYLLMYR